ncbi:MAG: amino acid permease [Halobacteriovoraceae bacterium]|nr:amino acid permease [Halobacteriovoraceae bacterium]
MKKLERRLGLGSVFAISMSSMLGSGIFVLPGLAVGETGPSVWLAYFLAAIGILPAAISKAELATAMPTSGGTYVYIERTFGPLFGTVTGLGLWLSLLFKCAFALIGFSAYLTVLAKIPLLPTSMTLLAIITLLNILGVGKVTGVLITVVSIACVGLVGLIGLGINSVDESYFSPFMLHGPSGLFAATAMVYISYAGVTKIAAIAEEIKMPEKNLPRGIFLSLLAITAIYCLVTFTLVGNLKVETLFGDMKPIYNLAYQFGGQILGTVAAVIGILTMTSMANAGILAASRFPFAMGRDQLLPSFFGKLNSHYLTPTYGIVFSSMLIAICLIFVDVTKIAKIASALMIFNFSFLMVAVIVLRESRVQWYKPKYKSPLYPLIQISGIIISIILLGSMGYIVPAALLGVIIPGIFVYLIYGRKNTNRLGVIGIRGKRKDLIEEDEEDARPHFFTNNIELFDLAEKTNVLVTLFGKERSSETLVEIGVALAGEGKVEVSHLIEVPEQTDLSDLREEFTFVRSLRRRITAMAKSLESDINYDPIVSHDILKTVHDLHGRLQIDWLLTEWGGKTRGAFTIHSPIDWMKDHLSCNILSFRDTGVRYIRKVLVLINYNHLDYQVVNIADHFASVNGADLTIAKFVKNDLNRDEVNNERDNLVKLYADCECLKLNFKIIQGKHETQTLIETTAEYDLIVFGQLKLNFFQKYFGNKYDRITAKSACSVIRLEKTANDKD